MAAATSKAVTKSRADLLPTPLKDLMQALMPDVYRLLPPDITAEQFRAACWLELTGHPELFDCVPESLRDSIIKAATDGLMPGRDCHFLGFKQKRYKGQKGAQCVSNYYGTIRVLSRSGKVRRAFAHPVREGDRWDFDMFQDRPIHQPAITLGKKPGKELFYYGAVMFLDGSCAFEVLTLDDLDAIKQKAPAHENGPWVEEPVMMRRKSCIKRIAKYVQLTPAQRAFMADDDARQREDIPPARHRQNIIDLFGEEDNPTAYSSPLQTGRATTEEIDPETGEVIPPGAGYPLHQETEDARRAEEARQLTLDQG